MEIRVLGDFEIAREILLGVARLFANPDGALVTSAPAALLTGFLLWSFLKWGMDNEKAPYPAKEFVFGIAFWLIFGGGPMSPKYTVELTSVRENRFQVIDDVPFLAAVPSWLASSFFGSARELLEDNFSPLHYSKSSESRTPDPLGALVKLYGSGEGILIDPYVNRSIATYMVQCYEIEQSLNASPLSFTRNELDAMPIHNVWDGVKVTYNFLTAKYFTKDNKNGVETDCATIWSNIKSIVLESTSDFSVKLQSNNAAKGSTNGAIEDASKMIYAASTHTSPNPLQIQQGLFLSFAMRDGLSQTSMEHWADKMVFEAQRKRVYESAGERTLFLQVMIPIITAIETFSFFIAPVMMVLSVLGGSGLALIMKYLMLVLFINLWGFIKVFVDLFTSITVQRAFEAQSSQDPLAFGAYANTFNEIEGFLSVAASLTVAIPFFAMFLLYGGVHSVMGVMRTLGGGSVDGNNMAPTMSTTMNNGVVQQGDTSWTQMAGSGQFAVSHQGGVDAALGSGNVTNATSGAFSNTSNTARMEVSNNMQAYQRAVTQAYGEQHAVTKNDSGGTSIDFGSLSSQQKMGTITKMLQEQGGMGKEEATNATAAIMATGGAKIDLTTGLGSSVINTAGRVALSADASAKYQADMTEGQKETWNKAVGLINNWGRSGTFGNTSQTGVTYSKINGTSTNASNDKSTSEVHNAAEQVNRSVSKSAAIGQDVTNQQAVGQTYMINWNALDPNIANTSSALTALYNTLSPEQQKRLNSLGIGDSDSLMKQTHLETGNGTSFAANLQNLEKTLGRGDADLKNSALDHQIMGDAYRFAGTAIPDANSGGFIAASNAHNSIANTINGVDSTGSAIKPVSTNNVQEQSRIEAQAANRQASAEKIISDAPGAATLEQNVINQKNADGSAAFGQDGKVLNPVQTSALEHAKQMKKAQALTGPETNVDILRNLHDAGTAGLNAVSKALTPAGQVWGHNQKVRAERINTGFVQQGVSHSMAAERGFEMFIAGDQKTIDGAFNNGKPNADAYAMNDASRILKTPEGQAFIKGLPEGEDKNRFMAAVGMFEKNKDGNTQYSAQMDEISAKRIDGPLPERAAAALIANASQDVRVPLMQPGSSFMSDVKGMSLDETRGAAHIIASTPELNNSAIIRDMAGYRPSEEINPGSISNGKNARETGKEMIVEDEINRLQTSGAYNFTPGVDNGRNIALDEDRLKDGIGFILGRDWDVNAASAYKLQNEQLEQRLGLPDEKVAAGVAALNNAGTDRLASRLNGAGYASEADNVADFSTANAAMAFNSGSITTATQLEAYQKIGEAAVNNQPIPQELLDSVGPAEIKHNQILERTSFNSRGDDVTKQTPDDLKAATNAETRGVIGSGAKHRVEGELMPSIAKSVAIAESGDGLVLFRGESSYQTNSRSEAAFESASNKADYAATAGAALVGVHDKAMNVAFNAAKSENGGEPPESFRSGTNQEYIRENNEDGSISYNGGVMGRFTYTEGDSRLMPTEDNKNYHLRDSVNRLPAGTGVGFKPRNEPVQEE